MIQTLDYIEKNDLYSHNEQNNQVMQIDLKKISKEGGQNDCSKGQIQVSLQQTPLSNTRKYFQEGGIGINDTQSYISSTTTAATRVIHLQNKLKDLTTQVKLQEDYEDGESVCCYYKNTFTDEILNDEIFMPQTKFSKEPHQSKLFWEKSNIDLFHTIKNIDTGKEYDVRKQEDLNLVTSQIPNIQLADSTNWDSWWDEKKSNQKEFEKACKLNLTETIKQLLQQTDPDLIPNINSRISEGWTPLHYFAYFGNTSICNLLIQRDVNIDSINDAGQTPLIVSCLENKQEVASLLIESGANINAQDQYLNTPLHYCFLNGDRDLLDIVMKKPYLDVNLRNNNNKLPYQESENEDLISYFKHQLQKKELQRNIKTNMQIIEYDDEDLHNLFSNSQSIASNTNFNNIMNESSQYTVAGLLGKGTFGEVFLVKERVTGKEFALKMLHKNKIIENNMYRYAITEKNILQTVDHPFIAKLYKAFQTKDKLFFLLENGKKGDLIQHLKYEKKFSESKAQFYAAEVLLAVEYLHSLDILYRDLKAQNILIAEDGHIRLTDFGLSKEGVKDYDSGARSFCGSIAYMPPEILRNQGHGVLIYEMLTGAPPYYGKDENTIYNNIQMSQLKFPPFVSRTAKSLLIKLLSKDPRFRPTPDQIKRHPFFFGIDWKQLALKNVKPPKSLLSNQHIYQSNEDIFEDKGEILVSPTKIHKLKLNLQNNNEQNQELFNKWTFIAYQ